MGGGPLPADEGSSDDDLTEGRGSTAGLANFRGGGAGELLLGRRAGEGVLLSLEAADRAAEDVLLGGGGSGASGFGFVLLFSKLRGGGGGGAESPLYGSQLVLAIGTL